MGRPLGQDERPFPVQFGNKLRMIERKIAQTVVGIKVSDGLEPEISLNYRRFLLNFRFPSMLHLKKEPVGKNEIKEIVVFVQAVQKRGEILDF